MTALLKQSPALVNARDESGQAPLHCAAWENLPASIHIQEGDGSTPLHAATMARQVEALRLLAGRKADLESRDRYGRTSLVVAAREMRGPAVVGALLDLGARIDAPDKAGDSALTLAAWRGSVDVVDLLLARGATVPVGGPQGRQLLESAVSTGLANLFSRLVAKDADLKIDLGHGRKLLHGAARGGSVPILSALLDRKFAVNQPDVYGWTPLHFAADMGRSEAVTFLLAKGADPNARTVMGQSAYNLAQDNADAAMSARLAGQGADTAPVRFPELHGPYLGQKPPGRTPENFAPGIVSARYGMHSNVVFSPDGSFLLFTRATDQLYVSFRGAQGRWGEAIGLGPEFAGMLPIVSPDGKYLFLSRNQRAYWADAAIIEQLRPKQP